ncbi:PssE/Cps14G family polysaccharide biosynthesis glycosyltransferase [Thalassomonas actiniarum]|uniref:Beta-1,4-galactosyltransferase n=1 Tax=Thalassomonas actiniarum TaxID=485447 RepID=A0AAE9YSG5_9GAMM|nr:PssE/Cps14G family polysaccharide biosynthesis glycosyltransferase [Thalassomonas actiniarum]WDD99468.1 beta-1,4-galactosyltransferase [Thalassomonas actiniarum]
MIFVTVGTFYFDPLIKALDALVAKGVIKEKVICQIGKGRYEPSHCEYFRYTQEIEPYIAQADLVICHGGTGSVLNLLLEEKKFLAVANTELADDHQTEFLSALAKDVPISWIRDLNKLEQVLVGGNIQPLPLSEYDFFNYNLCSDLVDFIKA